MFGLKCPDCGGKFKNSDRYCPHCGVDLDAPIEKPKEKEVFRERIIKPEKQIDIQPLMQESTFAPLKDNTADYGGNNAGVLAILEQWLKVKGFEKTQENKFLYIREASPDRLFSHTTFTIRFLKANDQYRLNNLKMETEANKQIRNTALNIITKGSKIEKFFSEAKFLSYVLFIGENVDNKVLNNLNYSKPTIPGLTFYSLLDLTSKQIAVTGKIPFGWRTYADFKLFYRDLTNLLNPISDQPVTITKDVEDPVNQWRFLSSKEKRARKQLFKKEFKNNIEYYSTYSNQALFDVTFQQGENLAKKAIIAYYITEACIEELVPSWDIEATSLGFESGYQQVKRDSERYGMQLTFQKPLNQAINRFMDEEQIEMIGYCQDCSAVRTGLKRSGDTIICPVSAKHKHIPHTLYLVSEEKDACCQKMAEKYRKHRGLFG